MNHGPTHTPLDVEATFKALLAYGQASAGTDHDVWRSWTVAFLNGKSDRDIAGMALVGCQVMALRIAALEAELAALKASPPVTNVTNIVTADDPAAIADAIRTQIHRAPGGVDPR
jgi:hypothetical protein